jgi:hypothetical protein
MLILPFGRGLIQCQAHHTDRCLVSDRNKADCFIRVIDCWSVTEQRAHGEPSRESAWKRLIFWDFPRGSWQYDLVVALILIFIFATPRDIFRDQPRASSVVLLSSEHGFGRVFIEADLLSNLDESSQIQRSQELIRQRTGKQSKVARVEPILDSTEREIKGFIAYTN